MASTKTDAAPAAAQEEKQPSAAKAPAFRTSKTRRPYRVLKPIHCARGVAGKVVYEFNGEAKPIEGRIDEEIAYYPAGTKAETIPGIRPDQRHVPSAGHGRLIPIDLSGVIDLTDQEARGFSNGQIEPMDPHGVEVPSGFIDLPEQEIRLEERTGIEPAIDDPRLAAAAREDRNRSLQEQIQHVRSQQLGTQF